MEPQQSIGIDDAPKAVQGEWNVVMTGSLPFRATDPNWVWSSDWQAGQTITWTTDEANLFTHK